MISYLGNNFDQVPYLCLPSLGWCMLEGDSDVLLFVQVSTFAWSLLCIFLHVDVVVFFVVVVCKCLVSVVAAELYIGVIMYEGVLELFTCMDSWRNC